MTTTIYSTTSAMLDADPHVMVDAIRFRINRLFEGEAAARAIAGSERLPLIERWHALQAAEARMTNKAKARADRVPSVHRKAHKASQRAEAASCPALSFSRA